MLDLLNPRAKLKVRTDPLRAPIVNLVENVTEDSDRTPLLRTVDEVADLLRTSRKAIYAMVERRQLPGVTHTDRSRRQ